MSDARWDVGTGGWSAVASTIVAEVDRTVLTGAPIETVFSKVCARLRRNTEAVVVWIVRRSAEGGLEVEAIDAGLRSAADVISVLSTIQPGHPILRALEDQRPDTTGEGGTPLYMGPAGEETMVAVPIRFPTGVHAAMCLHIAPAAAEDEDLLETMAVVANHLGLAWAHADEQAWLHLASQVLMGTETAVLIGDRNGTVQWVNSAFSRMTGWDQDEIRGQPWTALHPGGSAQSQYERILAGVRSGTTWRGVLVSRRRDGSTVRTHTTVAPVRNDSERIVRFVVLQEDLTDLEKARAEVEKARREALEKLQEDRAILIQTVSHELRTPLTIIRGVGKTMNRPGLGDEERTLLLESLERATADLDEKLQLVLATTETISRADRIPLQRVEIPALIMDIVRGSRQPQANTRVSWCGPDGLTLTTVRSAIESALRAVIDNALRFSAESAPVEVDARLDEDVVVFQIRDHGPGFDPDFIPTATEPFTQGDQSTTRGRGGLGIGLAVTKNLVGQLGGEMEIANLETDGGAVVTISLPQRRAEDRVEADRPDHTAAPRTADATSA